MDPHYQQTLINQVLYLHSLHHHGPPPSTSSSTSSPPNHLHLSNPTSFKKPKKNKKPKKKVGSFSGKEWPVKPFSGDSPATTSGWPELKLKPKKDEPVYIPSKQEIDIKIWNETQFKAVKRVQEFYKKNQDFQNFDDDVSSDDVMEDDDDVSSDDDGGEVGDEKFEFFWKLFEGDGELKTKYVEYCCGGFNGCEFVCLVCGGVNEKNGKRFRDCVGLVQHAVSIAKTKKIRDHRAFGKVVCKVLGWDIDKLPSSVVAERKDGEVKGSNVNADKDVNIGVCNVGLNKIMDTESSNGNAHGVSETIDSESMVSEDFAVLANAEEENRINQVLNDEHTRTCQQSLQELVINDGAGSSTSKKADNNE